ncbi:MAG: cation diffusion facilitator family transporter [Promethearchaeota archaeon]|jgi:cobalt-zinc-cadmium efflux system protein
MKEKKYKNAFSEHLFEYRNVEQKKLVLSLSITSIVMLVELIGGFLTNSIALLSDAGHMFTHSFAITISLIAILIARRPPCHHRTFGLYRTEVLAAFINGLFLLLVVVIIIYEAIQRFIHPLEVLGLQMMLIAFIGLSVNITSIIILHGSHKTNLNIKGVFYHMIADAVSSIGIVIGAIVILFTRWNFIDPLISIGISILIIYWARGILKESTRVLLETAPKGLDINIISDDLKKIFPEIKELYNIHLWTIIPEMIVFSAHMTLNNNKLKSKQEKLISKINKYLAENYNIIESTIQIISNENIKIC